MKTIATLLVLAAMSCLVGPSLSAQGSLPFAFSAFTQPYVPLSNATSLNNGEVWDDPDYIVPLGFDFNLLGVSSSEMTLGFGSGGVLGPVADEVAHLSILAAYTSDLADRGLNTDISQSDILYQVEGQPGSRICKIEWRNAGFWEELADSDTSVNFVNFQVWLYEGSNAIELRFGPRNIPNNSTVHLLPFGPLIGLIDTLIDTEDTFDLGTFYYLRGAPANPTIQRATTPEQLNAITIGLVGNPVNGQGYRFTPIASSSRPVVVPSTAWKVFPQATSGPLTISREELASGNARASVRITDAKGRTWLPTQALADALTTTLDLSSLPAGVYICQIIEQGRIAAVRKVVKQ